MEQNLGIVAPVPRGNWVQGTAYEKLNVVRNNGSSYMAIASSTNVEPGVATNWAQYWMLLNSDGINGTNGINGTDGATGPQGPQGPQGEPGTNGLHGIGVPLGGNPGDLLVKESTTAYDTKWKSPSEITVGAATIATQDENGNNIADTYETKNEATQLQNQITVNANNITKNSQLISRNDARLKTIEQVLSPSPYVTDDTVAYIKDLPAGAVGEAEIQIVGGMTYKAQNYFKGYTSATINGVTFTVNSDKSVTANGTATSLASFDLGDVTLQPGAYFLSGCPSGGSATTYDIDDFDGGLATDIGSGAAFSVASSTQTQFRIKIASGTTVNNITFYPMLNDGSSALSYVPYYEGIRNSAVTEIKSVGANLFNDVDWFTQQGFTKRADGSWLASTRNLRCWTNTEKKSGSMYLTFVGKNELSFAPVYLGVRYTDGSNFAACILRNTDGDFITLTDTTDANKTVDYISFTYGSQSGNYYVKGVSFSFSDVGYTPYTTTTLLLPNELQEIDGYGEGINGVYCNYFGYEQDGSVTFTKNVRTVNMATLAWQKASSEGVYYYTGFGANIVPDIGVCSEYKLSPSGTAANMIDKAFQINNANLILYIRDTSITNASQISGTLVYAIPSPEVTDITDLITADNYIDIQGGGSLTFVNQYSQAVPSTIEYGVKS